MRSIDTFRSNLGQGLAKNSLMDVDIYPPKSFESAEFLSIKCQSADLPGKTLNLEERKDYVTSSKHPIGVSFEELTLTFICSHDMKERKYFDDWMDLILGTNVAANQDKLSISYIPKASYYDEYVSDRIVVNLYTGRGDKSCSFYFRKIFPTTLAKQEVSWMGEDVLKLTVSFSYEYWEVKYLGLPNYQGKVPNKK